MHRSLWDSERQKRFPIDAGHGRHIFSIGRETELYMSNSRPDTLLLTLPFRVPTKAERRLRTSCDGCFLAKVKCSRTRPSCHRCSSAAIECRYSPSSRAGKPKSGNSTGNSTSATDVSESPVLSTNNGGPKGTLLCDPVSHPNGDKGATEACHAKPAASGLGILFQNTPGRCLQAKKSHAGRRKRSEDEDDETPLPKKTATDASVVDPRDRLACPYFQRNSHGPRLRSSCQGPGFETVSRLKYAQNAIRVVTVC